MPLGGLDPVQGCWESLRPRQGQRSGFACGPLSRQLINPLCLSPLPWLCHPGHVLLQSVTFPHPSSLVRISALSWNCRFQRAFPAVSEHR